MKSLKTAAALPLTLLALLKCSGDADGGAGQVSSGISSSKALSEVTAQEAVRGCEHMKGSMEAHFNSSSARTGMCTVVAWTLSTDESSCISARDACLKDDNSNGGSSGASIPSPADAFECSDANVDGWQDCSATVGEMEACLNDMLGLFDAVLNGYTCKDFGQSPSSSEDGCEAPPIDPTTGMVAIDPITGLPYVDYRGTPACDAQSVATTPATTPTPVSCQTLQTKCPTLQLFGEDDAAD